MTSNPNDGTGSPTDSVSFDIGNVDSDCSTYTSISSLHPLFPPIESSSILHLVGDLKISISPLDQSLVPTNLFETIESVTDPLQYPHAPDTRIAISNSFYYDFFDDACKQNNKNWMSKIKMSCF